MNTRDVSDGIHLRPAETDDFLSFALQRTGPSDLYSKPPRNPLLLNQLDDLDDFSEDDTSPLTEPIYNGR
jgi:hypothetical protein